MLSRLFRRRRDDAPVRALYRVVVAQAREPAFYRDQGVPDTVEGRFEMVVLHLFLLLHRLKGETEARRGLGQDVFDLFVLDMDSSLRELGVSDLKVPKKIRTMGEAFYGRVKVYDAALEGADAGALAEALARNAVGRPGTDARAFAAYVRAAAADLAALPFERIAAGEIRFPPAPTRGEP